MKCSVTFRHMKASDPIRAYAEERVSKISRLLDRGGEALVTLSVEKYQHEAHIELVTDGSLRLRGTDKSQDLYASIDAAVDRIMRQLKRYRGRIQNHRERPINGRELGHRILAVPPEVSDDAPTSPKVVRTETIVARSMNPDDAIMQMDLLDAEFLVFTNASSQEVNVMYRLPGGQYGLIEAHTVV